MRTTSVAAAAVTLLVMACAPAIQGNAASIARLERQRAAHPNSEEAIRSLGIAYFKAKRFPEAHTLLQQAATMDPKDGVAALFLGLTAESQNDLATARTAYSTYLQVGRTRRVRAQLEARLAVLQRKQLEADLKKAIANEQQLASVPGSPRTVAVLPFSFSGPDTTLEPLERGFAELLTTDLSRSPALTVLDRARVQALLDELKLQQSGVTAEGTGVRAGRILRAGRLVRGALLQQGEQLRTDALVIDVPTTSTAGQAEDNRAIDQLFTMEKNIALDLFNALGITLTTAQRNAIEQRPTRSLAAFLAYSRGLELEDRGDYAGANLFYHEALRIDPNFGSAQQKAQSSQQLKSGTQVSATTVENSLKGTSEGDAVQLASGGNTGTSTAEQTAQGLVPSTAGDATAGPPSAAPKDPLEAFGGDQLTLSRIWATIPNPIKPQE